MPVELLSPSLQDFVQLAAASGANRTIRSKENGLSATRLPTWASTNQKTMQDFLSAVRREFGSSIADAAQARLNTLTEAGHKPLKAFMVRDTVDEAIRTWQRNLNTCDKFLSGIDAAHSIDTAASAVADSKGISDLAIRDLMKEALKDELKSHFAKPTGEVSVATLESWIARSDAVHAASRYVSSESPFSTMPGSAADKFQILHMFDRHSSIGFVALQKLEQCRMLQPQGKLTPETVWEAVLEHPMPETVSREAFAGELDTAFKESLAAKNMTADEIDRVMSGLGQVKFSSAVEVALGKPLTEADLIDPSMILQRVSEKGRRSDLEKLVARDVGRVGNIDVSGRQVSADITFGLPTGDVSMPLGKAAQTTFPFADAEDLSAFKGGRPSSFTHALMENCRTATGGNTVMAGTLAAFLTQTPVTILGAQGNSGPLGGLIDGRMNEHMAVKYDIRPQENGTVKVTLKSNEDAEKAGRGFMEATIRTDGSIALNRLTLESPANVKQAAFESRIGARIDGDASIPATEKDMLKKLVTEGLREAAGTDSAADVDARAESAIDQIRGKAVFGRILTSIPDHLDPERSKTILNEMTDALRQDFAHLKASDFDDDGVFTTYYLDALRDSIESFDGLPLREKPVNYDGRMTLDSGRPSREIRKAGVREQLLEAVPDQQVRRFISMVACQAGLEASLSLQSYGTDPRQGTTLWAGAPTLADLVSESKLSSGLNYSFPFNQYSISFDPIVPGTQPDDPVNRGRQAHISLNMTQCLSVQSRLIASKSVPLMDYQMSMDVPLSQPNLSEGEVPAFTLTRLDGTKLVS